MKLATLFLAGCLLAGGAYADEPTYDQKKCDETVQQMNDLMWAAVDQRTYLSCAQDTDCTTSRFPGPCGSVANVASAAAFEAVARTTRYRELSGQLRQYLCPLPACALPPGPVGCAQNQCTYKVQP